MLNALTLLVSCQFAGEILARGIGLPIPGPVVGLLILLIGLIVRGRPGAALTTTATGLLTNLGLLFVPAGVGVVVHLKRLSDSLLPIAGAITVGTLVTIAVTGLVMQRMNRKEGGQ